jgi:UDP-N-acetylmuramoyl-tripeptide--D-alanyl-D-alanine ligase
VIDDSYNANPVSFERALAAFRELPAAGKKIIVFADMLELGAEEDRYHRELGERIAASDASLAFAYGDRARSSIEVLKHSGSRCLGRHFRNSDETLWALKEVLRSGDLVLFKGSHGMHVEKILDGIRDISVYSHT